MCSLSKEHLYNIKHPTAERLNLYMVLLYIIISVITRNIYINLEKVVNYQKRNL